MARAKVIVDQLNALSAAKKGVNESGNRDLFVGEVFHFLGGSVDIEALR